MENQLLKDPTVKPENAVLENALGKNYTRYTEFLNKLANHNLAVEWNYYNDGKSWLGKILHKKKNLCWLSIWDTGFKLTFLFTEKTINGVHELNIDAGIKSMAQNAKPTGKLIPIILLLKNKKTIDDGFKILEYKRQLK